MHGEAYWYAAATFLVGCGASASLIKYFVTKAAERVLGKIDKLSEAVSYLDKSMAIIDAKLDSFDYMQISVNDHEKRLAVLDARTSLNGSKRDPYSDS